MSAGWARSSKNLLRSEEASWVASGSKRIKATFFGRGIVADDLVKVEPAHIAQVFAADDEVGRVALQHGERVERTFGVLNLQLVCRSAFQNARAVTPQTSRRSSR